MTERIEVFADVTCPFTHVGLKQVVGHVARAGGSVEVLVRAWPLEWVNGVPMEFDAVRPKAASLTAQLGVDDFRGLRADGWPATTLPALELAAAAYRRDAATGLAVSLAVRAAVFEQGRDVADPAVLSAIAAEHAVTDGGDLADVQADYDDGRRRGVTGSPHFFVGEDDFFCPALDLGRDADGNLTARLDTDGLAAFLARLDR